MTLNEIALTTACSILLVSGLTTAQDSRPAPPPQQTLPAAPPAGSGGIGITTPPRRVIPMPFERSKWIVTLKPDKDGEEAGAPEIEDALTFADGQMASHVGASQGFTRAVCETESTSARCTLESEDHRSKREWHIECARDVLSGSMIATRPDGRVVRYRLDGRRAPPLEGTTWAIKLEPEAAAAAKGEPARHESIAFVCGKFVVGASALASLTPEAASYTLTTSGNRHSVRCEVARADGDSAEWVAEFDGDTVSGTVRSSGADRAGRTMSFRGIRVPERADAESRPASQPSSRDPAPPGR